VTPVRWGVLGAGWLVNQATARAIHNASGAALQATAARDLARAEATNPVRAYAAYEQAIADPDVDAVYVCLTNEAHLPWILSAVEAGKHVLCEKPLTLTAADAARAFTAAHEAGVLLVEAAWTRWHPRMQRVVELAVGGAIGDVEAYLGTFTYPSVPEGNYRMRPEQGGGALYDIGVYPLHCLLACLPDVDRLDVEEVQVSLADTGVDLTTKATLGWGEGTRGGIAASFTMPESQRLVLRGSDAELAIDDDQAFTSWREPSTLRVGGTVESFPAVDAYELMFAEVSLAIRGEGGWVLPPADSIRVAEAVDAIRAAAS
jgi:xylose dehydrogenase (NAD/NADP)